jgi:hypothetical protein
MNKSPQELLFTAYPEHYLYLVDNPPRLISFPSYYSCIDCIQIDEHQKAKQYWPKSITITVSLRCSIRGKSLIIGSQIDLLSLFRRPYLIASETMESSLKASHTDTFNYWTSYLAESEPCQFPRLRTSVDGPKRPMSFRVNPENLQKLQQLSVSDEAALPTLLRVAWGLLLRCYTGLDDVCFGYQEIGPGTWGKEFGPLNGMPITRFTADDMVSVADKLETVKGEYISGLPFQTLIPSGTIKYAWSSKRQLFDTAVVLRSLSDTAASNNTVAISQPLNVVLPEEVGTRASPRHPRLHAFIL